MWKDIQHVNVLYVNWTHLYVIQIRKSKHTYVVRWIQCLIWHLVACVRTKWFLHLIWPWLLVSGPSDFFNTTRAATLSWTKDSPCFCVADTEDKGRKCDSWNMLCTKKLKEVVASARTTFKWQSSKEGERFQDVAFKDWLSSRPLALRPIYWEISSDAYTRFKTG